MDNFATAALIVALLRAYGALGAGVAVLFLLFGLERCSPSARGAFVFRPLLFPGLVMLWPYVLWRWYALETSREHG